MITLLDRRGRAFRQFHSFTWAHIEPHSTQRESRSCKDCHQDPKVLGLGFGHITIKNNTLHFEPVEKPFAQVNVTLSQIGTFEGKALVKFNREGMRPFTQEELERILKVGLCLNCHPEKDKIFRTWHKNIKCPRLGSFK